jgi:hypothetical protein
VLRQCTAVDPENPEMLLCLCLRCEHTWSMPAKDKHLGQHWCPNCLDKGEEGAE